MSRFPRILAALLGLLAAGAGSALAQAPPCPNPGDTCTAVTVPAPGQFPRISFRAFAGLVGSQGQDSTVNQRVTLQLTRDLDLEQQLLADTAGGGFGGYNIYRVYTDRDTCQLELLRRYVYKDTLLWHFPDSQRVIPFVDPDSAGNLVKICRPALDPITGEPIPGTCGRAGDSVYVFQPAPAPHDGFAAYYTVVYATDQNLTVGAFEDKFVPDTTNSWANCGVYGDRTTCCNVNYRALNLMTDPLYVTGPPQQNLDQVTVVPNPYRGSAAWDPTGQHRLEFRGLPSVAEIRIYTAAGDLIRILEHNSSTSGAESWDLKNQNGEDVVSGIYMYRIWAPPTGDNQLGFRYYNHFVVIR
jgi:hypothetical protein